MTEPLDLVGWSALLLGLFAISVSIGAFRQPGLWRKMIDEVDRSPALQLLSGFMELFVGAAIYLAAPWTSGDLLAQVMKVIGALMMAEALVVMAICDLYMQVWLKNLAAIHRFWTGVTFLCGLALAGAAMLRIA
ncbi:hypothetical protein [Erythrobacter sp. HKB08]|uniref:hypothetical protein n=1 Tax=Erythrobacter sp. HKB08 TaxID=2502843 RepID=UPI0010091E29|nr:hypothetical protein [Erythrobacter sp. HKB08]